MVSIYYYYISRQRYTRHILSPCRFSVLSLATSIVICGILSISSAHINDEESGIIKELESLYNSGNYDKLAKIAERVENAKDGTFSREELLASSTFIYRVSLRFPHDLDQEHKKEQSELIKLSYGKVHSRLEILVKTANDQEDTLELSSLWQKCSVEYGYAMRDLGFINESIDGFKEAQRIFRDLDRDGLLSKPIKVVTGEAVRDVRIEDEKPLWKALGMLPLELLQRERITAARARWESTGNAADREELLAELMEYTNQYPTAAYAPAYTSDIMRMTDQWNIDTLLAAYERCTDKENPQFIYSSIGLANRLNDAGRQEIALRYLRNVEKAGIPEDRKAEFYMGYGDAYRLLGDDVAALHNYLVVKRLSNKYQSVDLLIRQIIDKDKIDMEEIWKSDFFRSASPEEEEKPGSGQTIPPIAYSEREPLPDEAERCTQAGPVVNGTGGTDWMVIVISFGAGVAVVGLLWSAVALRPRKRQKRDEG